MPVYVQAFACTHCAYPQMGGQNELIWMAGYIQRWFACLKMVTHPSTNHPQCKITLLIKIIFVSEYTEHQFVQLL